MQKLSLHVIDQFDFQKTNFRMQFQIVTIYVRIFSKTLQDGKQDDEKESYLKNMHMDGNLGLELSSYISRCRSLVLLGVKVALQLFI